MEKLSTPEILDARLDDWRKLAQALHARYRISDFNAGAAFIAAIAQAAEAANHHPDLKMTYGAVDVSLCTHEDGLWVTQQDIDMARKISEIARVKGLKPEPAAVTQLEIALDTAHVNRVAPFWSVLLTGSPDNTVYDSVFDPTPGPGSVVSGHRRARDPSPALALRPMACPRGGGGADQGGRSDRRICRRRLGGTVIHRASGPGRQQSMHLHMPRPRLTAPEDPQQFASQRIHIGRPVHRRGDR